MSPHPLAAGLARSAGLHGAILVDHHEPTVWLRSIVSNLARRIDRGTLPSCGHPALAAGGAVTVWAPNVIRCRDCLKGNSLAGTAEDYRCDRCDRITDVCTGCIAAPWPGPLMVLFGLCNDCLARELPGGAA